MILRSAQTAKIGKQFKKAREASGLSPTEVSNKTFINIDFIYAIESGDYSIFPARIFAVSYFEKYSIFLNIKPLFFDIYNKKNVENQEDLGNKKNVIKELNYKFSITTLSIVIAAIFFVLILLVNITDKSSASEQDPSNSFDTLEKKFILPSESDQETTVESLLLIAPLLETSMSEAEELKTSEFLITEGEIKNLSLIFVEDSWLEIYQGTSQIIFKLFQAGESFEIAITPPFKIIAGNANGITGLYDSQEINFTQVANKLNVSLIEVDNE